MGDLTKNFSMYEFECHCGCGARHVNPFLVKALQEFRDFIESEMGSEYIIIISSGVRCLYYNNMPVSRGGAGSYSGSQHTWNPRKQIWEDFRPCAADIKAKRKSDGKRLSPGILKNLAMQFGEFNGIGLYSWGIHVDVRQGRKARW